MIRRGGGGFALPAILVASVVMLTVLVVAISSVSSIRAALNEQHYSKLAHEAAESGLAVAQQCLDQSNDTVTWSTAKPLRPNTDCNGDITVACPTTLRDSRCGVLDSATMRSSYTVGAATADADGRAMLRASGTVQLLRTGSSALWATYSESIQVAVGAHRTWELATQFASGYYNTVMILNDGQAYGVGANSSGQMAQGNFDPVPKFARFQLDQAQGRLSTGPLTARAVVANWGSVLVLASDGQVYGSGSQAAGSLGDGVIAPGYTTIDDFPDSYRTSVPVRFRLPTGWVAKDIIPTSAGVVYVTAFPSSNPGDVQLFGAGRNDQGNLGDGTFASQPLPVKFEIDTAVGRISTGHLTVKRAVNFSPSGRANTRTYTCVIASDNQVYCAGRDDYGQFGGGVVDNQRYNVPRRAPLPAGITPKNLYLTDGTAFVLGSDNQLYAAGRNADGILGDGTTTTRPSFAKVRLDLAIGRTASNLTVTQVAVLHDSVHVLASDGNVYSAGVNEDGRFGNGTTTNSAYLTKMNPPLQAGETITAVKTSGSKTLARTVYLMTNKGRVMAAGNNANGQVGDGTLTNRTTPYVWPLPAGSFATDIQASTFTDRGTLHVVLKDGRVYAAGANQAGQIGDGTDIDRLSPVRMDLSLPIPRTQVYY